jgi:flagellar hook-associated protein 1 FlgK
METYLSRVTALSGATDAETNIGAAVGNLYNQFVTLSSTPDSTASQNAVVNSANALAQKFNGFSNQLNQIRNDTQTDIKSEVTSLNTALQNIARLNKSIASNKSINRSTADLEDQRDVLVKQVSGQLDVSYYTDGNGILVLQTKDGHLLADTEARTVDFSVNTLTSKSLYPDSSVSGVILHDTQNNTVDLASGTPGGKIGALLQLRDQTLPSYNAQLDELADKTMLRFNEQGLTLFTASDGTVPANDPSAYAGIAGNIKVNSDVVSNASLVQQGTSGAPIAVGSTSIIDKVINYTFGKTKDSSGTPNTPFNVSNTGYNNGITFTIVSDENTSLTNFANAFISGQGTDFDSTKQASDTENSYLQILQTKLTDGSAVNTDQEMTNMIQFQRSYGASAKMITALDELFRDLLNAI